MALTDSCVGSASGGEYFELSLSHTLPEKRNNTVTCRVVRVMKRTGSITDDWIYYHLGYKFS
jgi:hypothetical protein